MEPNPFYPGEPLGRNYPLEAFLPPYQAGMVKDWLADHAAPGSWILDPFGSNPLFPLEAADAGYRVLVVCNNPILRMILEVMAAAPSREDLQSVLSLLGSVKRGDERLEVFVQSLYLANCLRCHKQVPAASYTWQRDSLSMSRKIVRCQDCGGESAVDIDDFDLQRLSLFGSPQLPKAWALKQLGSLSIEQEDIAREAIDAYLPRPLYVLFTLINRALGLNLPVDKADLLRVMLLSACFAGVALWQEKGGRTRPRQLGLPAEFLEYNLWSRMEDSVSEWSIRDHPVRLVDFPGELHEPGICLVSRRLKSILPLDSSRKIEAVIGSIPRPNQAFWTLSALWSGWLLGGDAVTPMLSALDRQHYDWFWHTNALRPLMSQVKSLQPEHDFFAIQSEFTPGYSLAALLAARESGWFLKGFSFQPDDDLLQFNSSLEKSTSIQESLQSTLKQEIVNLMNFAGEPLDYNEIYMAALSHLMFSARKTGEKIPTDFLSKVQTDLMDALGDKNLFVALGKGTFESPRTWTLAEPEPAAIPFSEKVEKEALAIFHDSQSITYPALYREICKKLPGMIAPSTNLVKAILASYGNLAYPETGGFQLRQPDQPEQRSQEIQEIRSGLELVGRKLGFQIVSNEGLEWRDESDSIKWLFSILPIANLVSLLEYIHSPDCEKVLVIPGSRIDLIQYRRKHDLRIDEAMQQVHVVKFHHVKELIAQQDLDMQRWKSQLDEDPPLWEGSSQLPLLPHEED